MLIYTYTCSCRIHTDAMNNDERSLLYKYIPLTLFATFVCERELRPNRTAIYWPPLLWPSALCLSRSPGLLNRRPRGPLCWVIAFFIACYQQLLWNPTNRGPRGPLRPGLAFLIKSYQQLNSNCLRPLNRPLNLLNGTFDRHQAEITVMQFTGHSLLVHHSEVVPSPCPILSAELTYAISSHNCHWNVSLPQVHHFEWHFWSGRRSKCNICPKVNIIPWLEYELAYYDSAVHRFNHYTTRTPHAFFVRCSTRPVWMGQTCTHWQSIIDTLTNQVS